MRAAGMREATAATSAAGKPSTSGLGPLETRLAAQLAFDESKQRILGALLADNEDLRKQNMP